MRLSFFSSVFSFWFVSCRHQKQLNVFPGESAGWGELKSFLCLICCFVGFHFSWVAGATWIGGGRWGGGKRRGEKGGHVYGNCVRMGLLYWLSLSLTWRWCRGVLTAFGLLFLFL